jgi:regulation of enolase protein 1 (concanavalin A-like superfamily)
LKGFYRQEEKILRNFNLTEATWFSMPKKYEIANDKLVISTEPNTDLWQKTYYGFQHDNAHFLYNTIDEKYFSFSAKVRFRYNALFDQCGIIVYQDSENWMKAGIEFHDNNTMWLGSVVTNNGYSDWATVDIDSNVNEMWYRLSRRESDFLIENSYNGIDYKQMRIFRLAKAKSSVNVGLLACSPNNSTFDATFTDIHLSQCAWEEHSL